MSCDKENAPALLSTETGNGPLKFQMTVPSDPRMLTVVRSTVAEFAAVCSFDDEMCRRVTLAIDEALSNIIRYAYNNRSDQEIKLNCEAHSDCLEFTLFDGGEPPDPAKICAQPLDEVALGGRGTQLIRQIMDEVRYERVGEVNRLCLKKRLPGAKSKV